MFSFSLEMQMVSKCLIVYLVNHSQANINHSLLLNYEHENSPTPHFLSKVTRPHKVQHQEDVGPDLLASLLLGLAHHAGP